MDESSVILSNANYLSQTIDDFRQFIKGEKHVKEFDINSIESNLFRLISPSIKVNQIVLDKKIETDKKIVGNPNELLQSLINILNNAIDAILLQEIEEPIIFV